MSDLVLDAIVLTMGIVFLVQLAIMLFANIFIIKYSDRLLVTKWMAISLVTSLLVVIVLNQVMENIVVMNHPMVQVIQ